MTSVIRRSWSRSSISLRSRGPGRTGQSYEVTLRLSGSFRDKLKFNVLSEPYLPEFQIISLLLGETGDVIDRRASRADRPAGTAERRDLGGRAGVPDQSDFIDRRQRRGARDLHRHRSDRAAARQRHHPAADPTARVTLGQRISSRLYLTYARTLTGRQTDINEIILVEFDQNDQISWILSRNEDRSFGLDFRIKYVFK